MTKIKFKELATHKCFLELRSRIEYLEKTLKEIAYDQLTTLSQQLQGDEYKTLIHPITPPPELVETWIREANHNEPMFAQVAVMGARWGSDQELEACCKWAAQFNYDDYHYQDELQSLRRPKPPNLKEQALSILDDASDQLDAAHENILRRALEQLDD